MVFDGQLDQSEVISGEDSDKEKWLLYPLAEGMLMDKEYASATLPGVLRSP